jgi:hypothetical protein
VSKQPTYWVKIYLSGPIEVAKQFLRGECASIGLCVTIEPTTYIYTGGEESGYVVGLIQYPRFPATEASILERAELITSRLLELTHQASCTIMTPAETRYIQSESIRK